MSSNAAFSSAAFSQFPFAASEGDQNSELVPVTGVSATGLPGSAAASIPIVAVVVGVFGRGRTGIVEIVPETVVELTGVQAEALVGPANTLIWREVVPNIGTVWTEI